LSQSARRVLTTAMTHRYDLVVRGIAWPCTRCGLEGVAVAVIHPDFGLPEVSDIVDAEGGMELGIAKELLQEAGNPIADTIKYRGHGAGEVSLSSGCARCDAMFDPFDPADAVADAQDRGGVGSFRCWPAARGRRGVGHVPSCPRPAVSTRAE
jgi:hypothetical protein